MYKTDSFISADEIKEIVGISKSKAYSLIQELNSELKEKGYLREACVCLNPCTEITGISTFLQCLARRSFTVEL